MQPLKGFDARPRAVGQQDRQAMSICNCGSCQTEHYGRPVSDDQHTYDVWHVGGHSAPPVSVKSSMRRQRHVKDQCRRTDGPFVKGCRQSGWMRDTFVAAHPIPSGGLCCQQVMLLCSNIRHARPPSHAPHTHTHVHRSAGAAGASAAAGARWRAQRRPRRHRPNHRRPGAQ